MATAAFFLFIIIVIASSLIPQTRPDPRTDIVTRRCSDGRVKNLQNYVNSFNMITESMEADMSRAKFSYYSDGIPPDELFVYAQCMDDLSEQDCYTCFSQIRTLLPGCFPSPGGRVYLDGCYMRADNYSFYNETSYIDDDRICGRTTQNVESHNSTVRRVMSMLKNDAPEKNGYDSRYEYSDNNDVYGMAICWNALDITHCTTCLKNACNSVVRCLPSKEGRVYNTGCFVRYSDYRFTNGPVKRETKDAVLGYFTDILIGVAACTIAIGIGFFIGSCYCKGRRKPEEPEIDPSIYKRSLQFLRFQYQTLEAVTENFSESRKLGQGGFGVVFKGTLPDGRELAIKRLFMGRNTEAEDISNEMEIISRAQHKNLVRFLGCCFTSRDYFLVYEYLQNTSLDRVLFDSEKKKELDWKRRLGIIKGTAEGLEYLHKDCEIRIIHRDIKASNILLDSRFRPKIADFGLARFCSNDTSLASTAVVGTLGYMAPEYLAQGRLTEKVDVYSYGALVLEIVSGVRSTDFQSEDSLDTLITSAWNHFESNSLSKIIDDRFEADELAEIVRTCQIGLLCTQESPLLRPDMTMVLEMLRQKNMELPVPSRPPFVMDRSFSDTCASRRTPSIACSEYFSLPDWDNNECKPVI